MEENRNDEIKKRYREYQKRVSDDITSSDFCEVNKYPKVEIVKDKKTGLITFYDLDGSKIVEGREIDFVPCVSSTDFLLTKYSLRDNNFLFMIEYGSSSDKKIGIFDRNGFMLVDDIEKFYVKDKRSSFRKILDASKLQSFLSQYKHPRNGLVCVSEDKFLLTSIFDRDNSFVIDFENTLQEFIWFHPYIVFDKMVLGSIFDGKDYKICTYDIKKRYFDVYDFDIDVDQIEGNLLASAHTNKYYYFDDRTGTVLDITGKIPNYFFQYDGKLIHLSKDILTFDEFREFEKLREKNDAEKKMIDDAVTEYEKEEMESFAKKSKLQQQVGELTSKLGSLIDSFSVASEDVTSRFLHKISIRQDDLFKEIDDHYEIDDKYKSVLKFLNLSTIDFTNVRLDNLDFRDTNATINPQLVYRKDISNSSFSRMNFPFFTDFTSVNISGTDFGECLDFINLEGALVKENSKKKKLEQLS